MSSYFDSDSQYFSTRFSRDYDSWIDWGTPDASEQIGHSGKIDMLDDYFWSTPMRGMSFDGFTYYGFEPHPEAEFQDRGVYTIFDSASADILISSIWYDDFIEKLAEVVRVDEKGFWKKYVFDNTDPIEQLSDCSLPFPSIQIILNGVVVEVSVQDYVRDVSAA